MRTRVGLAIAHDALRAVVVRGAELVWAGEEEREPGAPFADAIVALVSRAPLPRRPRPVLAAAIGPHASQVKMLAGLPPVEDENVLAAIVRENASAFFLENGSSLCITGIRTADPGTAWAAAIEATHVENVRRACATLGVRLSSMAPSAVVLPLALRGERFQWADGPVTVEITMSDAGLAAVRRMPASIADNAPLADTVSALASLGERACRFADAYGAAVAPVGDPLTLGPAGDVPWNRRRLLSRLLPPALVASLAGVALLLSPLVPLVVARHAEASLREIYASEEWGVAVDVLSQLERVTSVLTELDAFVTAQPLRIQLLADLARTLPELTAIERLDVVDNDVRLVALTPRASAMIAAVRAVPEVTSVTLVGEATRAIADGGAFERVTLTFRHRDRDHVRSSPMTDGVR